MPSSVRRERPKLTAKKAFGESPKKEMEAISAKEKKKFPAMELPEPVVAAATAPTAPEAPEVVPAAQRVPESGTKITPETKPEKIKVGGKDYTLAELEAAMNQPPPAPVQPQPQAQPQPPQQQPQAAPQPTPEQIAAKEQAFIETMSAQLDAPLTEEQIDTLLSGGKDAVELLTSVRKRDMATAILQARKQLADGFNPLLKQIYDQLIPLSENHQQLTRYSVEQAFFAKHKDFATHSETARNVAEELVKRFPEEVRKLSTDQFIDEVARQTDQILASEHLRWFPQGGGNWRAGAAVPLPAGAAAPQPPPPAAPPAAPQVPAAAGPRVVRPPASNAPSMPAAASAPTWNKAVARSMR